MRPGAQPPGTPQSGAAQPGVRQEDGRIIDQRGNRTVIRERDDRVIIREGDRVIIRHDETERLRRGARDVDIQRRGSETVTTIERPDGSRIITVEDEYGRVMRRIRRNPEGREFVLIESGPPRGRGRDTVVMAPPINLPPVRLSIPRELYIFEADRAPVELIEETFMAPPVERVERAYTLDEIRTNRRLREKVRRVDLSSINFDFGSAEVPPDQVGRLDSIAEGLMRAIRRNPQEVFLIEGHTDAVGADMENLALSDRRAEAVAAILTDQYQVPPENLVTQGYGEQFLKIPTQEAERENRRVSLRRISPLMRTEAQR
jgi:OOP family OmpA-OmpF porin